MNWQRGFCGTCEKSVVLTWDAYIFGDPNLRRNSHWSKIEHRFCLQSPPISEKLNDLEDFSRGIGETKNHCVDDQKVKRTMIDGFSGYLKVYDNTVACCQYKQKEQK